MGQWEEGAQSRVKKFEPKFSQERSLKVNFSGAIQGYIQSQKFSKLQNTIKVTIGTYLDLKTAYNITVLTSERIFFGPSSKRLHSL